MPETVLVVDDNPVNVALMDRLLRHRDLNVISATNGPAALLAVDRHRPDLILVDVRMPGMDGITLTRHLKSNPGTRGVPVVLLTASTEIEDRDRGLEAGADDVVSKPINPSELWVRMNTLLRLSQSNADLLAAESALLELARRVENRNPFAPGHCERIAAAGQKLAAALGYSSAEMAGLRQAAVLHDLGKIALSDELLLKPGPLEAAERRRMAAHPVIGESLCAPIRAWGPALPIIRHHHEKLDGSGYPDGLRGEAIPRTARLFAVVEVYEALTHAAPWRPALSPRQALETLTQEAARGWWECEILEAYKGLL